jgi:hypothetical protein
MSKKRLSFKQIEQKTKLLQKYRSSVKGLTKKQVSKHWQQYRGKKYVIEELPKHRQKLSHLSKDQRQYEIEKYFDKKDIAQRKIEYGNLIIEKKHKQHFSEQDYYKLKKGADLDETIQRVFDKKKPRYVLVTLKIRLKETHQIIFVSDSLTLEAFEQLEEFEVTAMEKILEKLSFVAKYDGFELISTHLRLIYKIPERKIKK